MPSSSADAIAQSLNEQFQADDVFFQIVEHSQVLHVYLNHQPGAQIDYTRITAGIQQAVVSQFSSPADGFWLYSRELGNTEPNWQTYIQTPRHALTQSSFSNTSTSTTDTQQPSTAGQGISMVQLTGTTDEMQKIAGFAAVSQADANAATEIVNPATTASVTVKTMPETVESQPEDEAATEMVPLGSDAEEHIDDEAATELVGLGGQSTSQIDSLMGRTDDESLDEHSATELVPLSQEGPTVSPQLDDAGKAWDEESATEMVSLNHRTASQPSPQQSSEAWNEESATEMVSLNHRAASPSSPQQSSEAWNEESATEMVSLNPAGMAMPSLGGRQSGAGFDEDSATEMVQLSGSSGTHVPGVAGAATDEDSATEVVPLAGEAGSVLSSFAAQMSGGQVDEDSATEIVSLGAQAAGPTGHATPIAHRSATEPITAEFLKLALNRQFQPDRLQFQVTMRDDKWHICANRAADVPFDFDRIGDRVRHELQSLENSNIDSFWFYSRAAGQRETEHKALISLSEGQISRTDAVAVENKESAAKPTEVNSGSPVDLSQYCFVRNRLLLQGKLLPPSDQVARLLKTFHELPDSEKMSAVESVDRIFKGQPPQTSSDWLQELEKLPDSDLRKAAIWFSRYCEQPADTIQQINDVLSTPKAVPPVSQPASQAASQLSGSTAPASGRSAYQSPYSQEAYQSVDAEEASSSRLKVNYPKWLRFVLPLVWVAYMAIVVVTSSSSELYSLELPECQSSASPQACELAALVATPDGVRSMETSAPYTPTYEEEVALVEACEQDASFFSGSFNTPITSTLSSVSETLPGVYLVDIQYPDPDNSSGPMVRTACVASLDGWGTVWDDGDFEIPDEWAEEVSGPQVFALDEIPVAWPATPYDGNPFVDVVNQVGILLNPFFWAGVNVFLAAVGLLLTTSLGIGVAAASLETVLIVATIYGALDSVLVSAFHFIPLFSLFTSPFRRFAILSGAGGIFKDFMLDRSNLFKLVLGLTLLFFIQFIGKFALGFFMGVSAAFSAFS